jgi:hypothetical protein
VAYKQAVDPRELYVVPNAGHVDPYDRTELIPFDNLEAFFAEGARNGRRSILLPIRAHARPRAGHVPASDRFGLRRPYDLEQVG